MLKSHWVMVVMDPYTRYIIGFAVHTGDCTGVSYCRMFNSIITHHLEKSLAKYLSSDNDPLFLFHRWPANLRVLDIEELKSIPGYPASHPFIERIIRAVRNEYLDQMFRWFIGLGMDMVSSCVPSQFTSPQILKELGQGINPKRDYCSRKLCHQPVSFCLPHNFGLDVLLYRVLHRQPTITYPLLRVTLGPAPRHSYPKIRYLY